MKIFKSSAKEDQITALY